MDPRYNWPPQGYTNGQYVPYNAPQQPNGYQQNGYAPHYPPMQMQMPQGYPQQQQRPQQYPGHPQVMLPQPPPQHYQQMPPQSYPPPQPQLAQHRAQPQVVIPARAPNVATPMQMQAPRIRHVQMPVQRTSGLGHAQRDGAADHQRQYNVHQPQTPSASKPAQRSQSSQENKPRAQQQQRSMNTPVQNQSQHRAPLQPQSTPQQRTPSLAQTPSAQYRTPSIQQTPSSSKSKMHPQVVIPKSSSHHLTPTKHAHAPPKALPADLSVMLLSAADEYIATAQGMGSLVVREKREGDLRQYYKLMATAMGCMDAVLKDFSLLPRDEAKLRLRYVTLMVEETDNTTDIDDLLSKQISLCGRCRLQDLKYATLHLQARYQFQTNHRAALKALDKPISEAETFQHIPWVYAFRFLKVSLILQIPGRVETVQALQQLHAILGHAEKRGDRAIYVACNALEAMVHLRSGNPDRLEQAQRAIALARSQQLQVSAKQLGSFGTLIDIIDLACAIQHGQPNNKKSAALIESVLDHNNQATRCDDGVFTVLIERSAGGNLTFDTGGVFRKSSDGRDELVFAWLPTEDVKTLCFHICALDQNIHEKGLSYMKEAHQRSRSASKRNVSYSLPISLGLSQTNWNKVLDWHSMFTIGLIGLFRDDQATTTEALTILRKRIKKSPYDNQEPFARTLSYLTAISDQTQGYLDSALSEYSSDILILPDKGSPTNAKMDIGILAALNRLLILRNSSQPQAYEASTLRAQLQAVCENHPNQYIRMAFRLVHAISNDDAAINRQKTLMQTASNRANDIFRNTQNREFVVIALCYFTKRFFADQVGEKSIQAIKATRQNAKPSRRPLWPAVALGLCITTFQRNGLIDEAQKAQAEYEVIRRQLPPALSGEEDVDAEGEEDAEDDVEEM